MEPENPYKIAWERERKARRAAEKMLDEKTREVYSTLLMIKSQFVNLQQKQQDLETANQALRNTQSQLVQSEKLASIGQLAAGVAHEINNPVGFVLSNLETLRDYAEDLQQLIQHMSEVIRLRAAEGESVHMAQLMRDMDYDYIRNDLPMLLSESKIGLQRVREIVNGLRSFARVSESDFQPEDLNRLVESTIKVTWNELKYHAKVCFDLAELPPVRCNAGQISQVLVNLVVNASHAMAGTQRPGHLSIVSRHCGDHVTLAVSDNGCGMPSEVLDRIFDPFFTTKPVGLGTGLGLSVSHGLIQKHRGRIEVSSTVGEGTTFTLVLPLDPDTCTPTP